MNKPTTLISAHQFGVSFSIKQCCNFSIDPHTTLDWLIRTGGFRRFRLMSYWDELEKTPGKVDFSNLDWQLERITKAGGEVTLCLGARQPRWPENHWPEWAWQSPHAERSKALLAFVKAVVTRYKNHPAIVSYQLENEALLKGFGERAEVDRARLRQEYLLVKQLDPTKPILMSTSTSWGIPLRRPVPDIVGFSYYQVIFNGKKYTTAFHTPLLHKTRKRLIKLLKRRPVHIHELQLEPWGPKAIWGMPPEEQDKSMGPVQVARNILLARQTGLYPVDLWGGEWWYWRTHVLQDSTTWQAVKTTLRAEQPRVKG
jgi:hypothetical protein